MQIFESRVAQSGVPTRQQTHPHCDHDTYAIRHTTRCSRNRNTFPNSTPELAKLQVLVLPIGQEFQDHNQVSVEPSCPGRDQVLRVRLSLLMTWQKRS